MSDDIVILGRTVRERTAWALLGVVGFPLPAVGATIWMVLFQFPPLLVLPIALLVWLARRVRGRPDTKPTRIWVLEAWLILTPLWLLALAILVAPPGGDLPQGSALMAEVAVLWALYVLGSVAIAVGSYEFARRRLAPVAPV